MARLLTELWAALQPAGSRLSAAITLDRIKRYIRRSVRLPLSGAMWPAESIKINLQVIASPGGDVLWVSGELPGAVHDKNAEWIWGVLTELEAAGLVTLADKGYQGSAYAKIPYRGKNNPESQKEANHAHARLRAPGERANAQLKTWKILRSSAAAHGVPANSPKPSTYCKPVRHKQDKKASVVRDLTRKRG
jgi:hypothetical protein